MRSRAAVGAILFLGAAGCLFRSGGTSYDIKLTKQVVANLAAGEIDAIRSHFDDVMDASLSRAQLAALWDRFTAAKGSFVSEGSPSVENRRRVTVVSVPVQMSKAAGIVRVYFDSDGKIDGLYVLNPGTPVP